jgi:hypothetical protein
LRNENSVSFFTLFSKLDEDIQLNLMCCFAMDGYRSNLSLLHLNYLGQNYPIRDLECFVFFPRLFFFYLFFFFSSLKKKKEDKNIDRVTALIYPFLQWISLIG